MIGECGELNNTDNNEDNKDNKDTKENKDNRNNRENKDSKTWLAADILANQSTKSKTANVCEHKIAQDKKHSETDKDKDKK